jgi:phosphoglycerate dehydrogenase-like enzyme
MIFEAAGDDTLVLPSEEDLVGELADAEVFFGYHSPDVFASAQNLKWIQTTSAGLDMILTPDVVERGLLVTNASGLHAAPVVETAWALTLAVSRCLKTFGRQQNEHVWESLVPYVLMIACPATAETQGLIGPKQIALLKPTAILVNIARGGIVDEPALIECLTNGRIAGAGLDVTKTEPLPADDPLWDTPRLVITPHIAGLSGDRSQRLAEFFCENLRRYRLGETLMNLVDQSRGYPVPGT